VTRLSLSLYAWADLQATANETPTLKRCSNGWQQVSSSTHLMNVAHCPQLKGFSYDVRIGFLADEQDFRMGSDDANSPGGFHSIQLGKSDIKEDQIRLKLFGFLDGF
jgi:hypothetical protein